MNILKALVNAIGMVKNDEKSLNMMDDDSEEGPKIEKTENSAQTIEQFQKLVPTRLREENTKLKNDMKDHIATNALLQHRINYLEAEIKRQDDRLEEYEVDLRDSRRDSRVARAEQQRVLQALQQLEGQRHVHRIQNCRETPIPREIFLSAHGSKFHVDPQCPTLRNAAGRTMMERCKACEKQVAKDRR